MPPHGDQNALLTDLALLRIAMQVELLLLLLLLLPLSPPASPSSLRKSHTFIDLVGGIQRIYGGGMGSK